MMRIVGEMALVAGLVLLSSLSSGHAHASGPLAPGDVVHAVGVPARAAVGAFVVARATEIGAEAQVRLPSLESTTPGPRGRTVERDAARPLPRTATVCLSRDAHQCWSEPGETRCANAPTVRGEVFRVVIDDPERVDVRNALADCQAEAAR
jgi:hypothetical protein